MQKQSRIPNLIAMSLVSVSDFPQASTSNLKAVRPLDVLRLLLNQMDHRSSIPLGRWQQTLANLLSVRISIARMQPAFCQ